MPQAAESYFFTSEEQLSSPQVEQIDQHWYRLSQPGELQRGDHLLRYTQLVPANAHAALLIVSGRSELYPKFKELAYDMNRLGYAVFIPDHMGQGMSDRPIGHPHKGHIERFDDYADDMAAFIEEVVQPHGYPDTFIMAHSMGGAISLRMLQTHDVPVHALVLSAPMIGINLAPFPAGVARGLAKGLAWVADRLGHDSYYAPTQGDYQARPFDINRLTTCQLRYQRLLDCMAHYPQGQLGGPTVHWLREGIATGQHIIDDAHNLKVPVLLMQAGDDVVVDNRAQDLLCQKMGQQPRRFAGAQHELWLESDGIRNQVLTETHEFFLQHASAQAQGKPMYKAVISDLDGTLLSTDHKVSQFTHDTIERLFAQDIRFVIATGRHYLDVHKMIEAMELESYLITCNGAQVHNKQGELIYNAVLPEDVANDLLDIEVPDDILLNVYLDDAWMVNRPDESLNKYSPQSGFSYQVQPIAEMNRDRINKVFYWGPHETLLKIAEQVRSKLGDSVYSAFSLPVCFEVMAHGVNKGHAVEVVLDEKQIDIQNAIAFGDGMNDFEMLSVVGQAVIMENALPELKQRLPQAHITGSNGQDGVANYLITHVLNQESQG